jgi:integrase
MATKRQRGATWHYTVRRAKLLDKPIYLTFDDPLEGDAYVARLEQLLDAGIVPDQFKPGPALPATIGEALVLYQRAVSVKDREVLRVLERRHGDTPLAGLDYAWAELWIEQLKKVRRLAPSRIRKLKGSLSRALDWVVVRYPAALAINPLRQLPTGYSGGVRVDAARERRLEAGEESALRAELARDPELRLLTVLALETAMRLRELYTLDWSQIDLGRRTVFLEKTKNGDKRQVPLSSVALREFEAVRQGQGPLIAHTGTPAQITARLSRRFARAAEAAGCAGLRFHDLRHEATCRLYERTTLTDVQIATITGHRDPRVLKRYANLRASDLAQALW